METKKLQPLQVLRGLASLAVVFYHYRYFLNGNDNSGKTIWDNLFGNGIIGVTIFFSISGFIMIYTTYDNESNLREAKKFIVNRLLRIMPLYYIVLVFSIALTMITNDNPNALTHQDLLSAITFTVYENNTAPNYIGFSGLYDIRWTLNYEMYFYVVFTLSFLLLNRILAIITWSVLSVFIIPFSFGHTPTLSVRGYHFENTTINFLTNPIFFEFITGCVAGYLFKKIPSGEKDISKKYIILSALTLISIFYGINSNFLTSTGVLTAALFSIFILFICLSGETINKFCPRPLVYLGEISFSLYLIHTVIGNAVFHFAWSRNLTTSENMVILFVVLSFALSLGLSHITHNFIEIKLTKYIKKRIPLLSKVKAISYQPQ